MKEQIKESLKVAKAVTEAMLEDKELMGLTTELSKRYLDSYMAAGFSREEAMQLVVAISSKSSS